ncbi:uncharacterized protein LOC141793879 [Halichoeres trimaculatus]|uniref:uncharacterized protein LOC141793879 n=1 Tax=Halichoeres trimaculatus TaxID=147232 RepID=UPI003D9F15FE
MKTIDIGGMPHLCLFAIKDITPGEEVTYNYGNADWPWRKQQQSTPDVLEQTVDDSDRPQQQSTPDVLEQTVDDSDRPQQQSTPDVLEPTVDDSDRPQQQSTPDVLEQTVDDSDRPQQQSTPDVLEPTVDDSDRPQQQSTPDVLEPTVDDSDRPQQQSTPDVLEPTVDDSDRPQLLSGPVDTSVMKDKINFSSSPGANNSHFSSFNSRMAKLRKHHEECFNQHKIAEEQRNAKERQHTAILLKRARLAQELAELDALLTSQSPLDNAIEDECDDIQPLASSDASLADESSMASDPVDSGEPAAMSKTRAPAMCSSSSSLSACPNSEDFSADDSKWRSLRQRKAPAYKEDSLDESDHTDYNDSDYVPDSVSDEDTEIHPAAKNLPLSLQYPLLSSASQATDSGTPVKNPTRDNPEKRNSNTPRKRKSSSPHLEKIMSSTPKKSRVQHLSDSIKVCPPSKSGSRRVYNKRNYCLYCLKPSSKIARHLEAVHGNVKEVARAVLFPKNSKERRNALNILRRRGNFAYNAQVVSKGAGELQACYRPRKARSAVEFIHCFHCQGLYAKRTLWKHMKICPAREETDDESRTGKQRVRSKCALKTAVVQEISEGLKSVISCMSYDEVTQTIQNDKLLLQFGQHLFDLNGSRKNRHDLIRQRLRELGRLLVVAQKKTPIRKAEELIYPSNFNRVISAVKELAGYNTENNTFQTPSLALKVGHSLGVLCELVETENLSTVDRDDGLVEYAREFKTIKKFRWKALITRGATTTMKELKWNAPPILPFTEDVKCLDSHLEKVKDVAERMLKLSPSAHSYATLAKVTLAQVIIFNRRREGEVSRMELATFMARKKSELNADMEACLTPLEKKMCDFFTRVEIRGKRGRGVPVLLKPSMLSAMELLAETREMCGVLKENIYMFARPGALSAYRGGECIQKFARESGAKNPEALTSTKLRKHIATMSQVLNLQENESDQLADFLGHDIRVHRQYYRLPQGTLQLAKMSKVLLAVEKGTLSQYKGQALDDIEINPEEKVDCSQEPDVSSDEDELANVSSAIETTAEDDHEAEVTSPPLSTSSDASLDQADPDPSLFSAVRTVAPLTTSPGHSSLRQSVVVLESSRRVSAAESC